MSDPIVIVSSVRTPLAAFQGEFSTLSASDLGAIAIRAAIERAGLGPSQIDNVFMGNVLTAGQGQAPARQAAIKAGVPVSVGAVTVSKVCGSGMQAAMFAHDALVVGTDQVIVAGGMESMTNSPYLLSKARSGYRAGHGTIYDHMMLDGLEDAYEVGRAMGTFGEDCAAKYGFTRAEQDQFAVESVSWAQQAARDGSFEWEIVPVPVASKTGEQLIKIDERPQKLNVEKIPTLKSAFAANGTLTAASSSGNADGAAALVLMRESTARALGCRPIARILGHASHSQEPGWFTVAPVGAIAKIYNKLGLRTSEVDVFEINEAFASVTLAAMKEHGIERGKVNIHGGACALGHPIGASGARIIVTLIGALRRRGGRIGVASLCIGGGEATAMAIELAA